MIVVEKPIGCSLTRRQAQILTLISEGLTPTDVGEIMGLQTLTVYDHLKNTYRRLEIDPRTPGARRIAISRAQRWRLIPVKV